MATKKISKELRKKRLMRLALAIAVDTNDDTGGDGPIDFDMAEWGRHYGDHKPEEKNFCGTTACALGTAAMIPEFKRAGLRMEWQDETAEYMDDGNQEWVANVKFGKKTDILAGAAFFGLSKQDAVGLFAGNLQNRLEVIERCLQLAVA